MVEIVSIGPKPKQDAIDQLFGMARKTMPEATGGVLVLFTAAGDDDSGSLSCMQVNVDVKELSLASVRLARFVNKQLDEL